MARYDTYLAGDDRVLEDLDSGFVGLNNRLRPDQLKPGILADSQNGRMELNGQWSTRKGISNKLAPLASGASALTLPFFNIGTSLGDTDGITAAHGACGTQEITESDGTTVRRLIITLAGITASDVTAITVNTATGDEGKADVTSTLTGIAPTFTNGIHSIRAIAKPSSTSITFAVIDYTINDVTFSGGSAIIKNPALADTAVNEVYGSCIFSDPNASSESYIILASNTKAVAVKISDTSTTFDLAYPGVETVSSPVEMIQAFNKVYIFREGDAALFVDLSTNNITGSPAMAAVEEGAFSLPSAQLTTAFEITNGEAKATKASHGYVSGDVIQVKIVGDSGLTLNDTFTVSRIDSNDFFFFPNNAPDLSSITSNEPTFIKELPSELGFTHMPAPKYGVVHQRRLAVPYRFDLSSSTTVTDRKIFDEVILSRILDTDTYDQRFGQFRFNAGMADFNVGMLSFSDDKLIVFNRNSIHQVTGQGEVQTLSNQLLTDEVGLIAKNTVAQVGNQILFLSDNGVYGLTFIDRYNLRGTELPLSESIQETINRINKAAAEKSVAVYFDNRYYIAIPTDGSPVNNTLLVYNFLNKSWESIDSVDNSNLTGSNFEFTNLLVTGSGLDKGVYVVNTDGGIHKLETEADGFDRVITQIGSTTEEISRVKGSATTRMFTLNSIDRKKWNNFELHLESSADNSSDVSITGIAENPDSEPDIDLLTASDYLGEDIPAGEDVSIRARIGNNRAYGFQMKIENTLGLPIFRAVKVAGVETFRSTSSVQ
tara:strand:- start:1655 stop:3970 length:2316 start_codon:yes stop_codon:yes gene_type:complete